MKNSLKIPATFILLMLPLCLINAQDKKSEQKIKIVTLDRTGNKTIIDTVFTGNAPDSMTLKDGTVVHFNNERSGGKQVFIASSSNEGDNDKTVKNITIVNSSPDSEDSQNSDVYIYKSDSKPGNFQYKVIRDNGSDSGVDKSRFIIAKDGMVVTVEGEDAEKTQALAKEIEKKLGVNSDNDNKEVNSPAGKKPRK